MTYAKSSSGDITLEGLERGGTNSTLSSIHTANEEIHKLAERIGNKKGAAIYRRFTTLNANALLCLEFKLQTAEQSLYERGKRSVPGASSQASYDEISIQTIHELKLYNDLLLQQNALYSLPDPKDYDLYFLVEWIKRHAHSLKNQFSSKQWTSKNQDLVALSHRHQESDLFSRWIQELVVPLIQEVRNRVSRTRHPNRDNFKTDFTDRHMDNRTQHKIIQGFIIIMASLLPTSSIIALYYLPGHGESKVVHQLVFIAAFAAIFSLCLVIFTSATRLEVFTASVALASVQVVFLAAGPQS